MASVVFLLVLTAILVVSLLTLMLAERDMRGVIGRQQYVALSSTAAFIDQELKSKQQVLRVLADSMTALDLHGAAPIGRYLARQGSLRDQFFNVAVIAVNGDLVATMKHAIKSVSGATLNLRERPYFEDTLARKAGVISAPMNGSYSGMPLVVITQPVFDAAGKVVYVLAGSVNLREPDFLAKLDPLKPGKSGYIFIMTSGGILVEHPDKSRILQPIEAHGAVSAATHAAMNGFEGWTAGRTQGVNAMFAYKRITSADWILASVYPADEAFQPLYAMRGNGVLAAILLAALAGVAGWHVILHLLQPLETLRKHIVQIRRQQRGIDVLQIERQDEIGELSRAFHALVDEREQAELQTRHGDALLRSILEQAPDAVIGISEQGRITEWNREAEEKFGWSREQAIGTEIGALIGPGMAQDGADHDMASWFRMAGQASLSSRQIRAEAVHRDGHTIAVEISMGVVTHDGLCFSTAFLRDISDRLIHEKRLAASEKRARTIADAMPALISYIDSDLRYQFSNVHYRQIFDIEPHAMVGKPVSEVIGEKGYASVAPQMTAALRGERVHFERQGTQIGCPEEYFMFDYIPDLGADGSVAGFYVLGLDISDRRKAELRQAASEKRLKLITDHMPVVIVYIDPEHRLQFSNATFEKWFGVAPQDMLSRKLSDVYGAEAYHARKRHLERAFQGEEVEYEFSIDKDGLTREFQTVYVPDIQENGVVAGVYGLIHEITKVKAVESALKSVAATDTLTGIANRRKFDERLAASLQRAYQDAHPLTLAYLDIDRFKAINDSLGHHAGDEVLKEFAARLVRSVRSTDLVARLAGDEFVIIFEHVKSVAEVRLIAAKIIDTMHRPFELASGPLGVTTSIGVVILHAGAATARVSAEQLLDSADRALYNAKNAGRDGFDVIELDQLA
ncbi:sensory box protein [Janthinobacterium agaricidamnosum NBRC 102515 = DSM 9628]|uniref:Sensory box protein n=2 Tax=Janthinobacterium agaricidamnosum TaxID=55508 RepID=W0V7L7_9BURK|nr:sensory box protein [Janthinobacterium agaricidamnosum NBRC 102515 = DSM 9628]